MNRFFTSHFFRYFTLGLAALVLSSNVALAVTSGTVGILPANPREEEPLTKSWFLYEVDPGAVIEDAVKVINGKDKPVTFKLEAVDAIVIDGGGFGLLDGKEKNENLGSWVALEKTEVEVPPMSEEFVKFTVTVPQDAEVGDHIGGLTIMAQQEEPDQVVRQGGASVQILTRVGVRMYLTVLGDIVRDFRLLGRRFYGEGDDMRFAFKLENQGNIRAEFQADIRIYGLFGLYDTLENVNIDQAFPKKILEKNLAWPGEKDRPIFGPFLALIKIRDAYEPMQRENSEVFMVPAGPPINTWAFTFFIPYTQTIIFLVLLFLIWFIRQFLVWRKMVTLARQPVIEYKVKKNDHLMGIADRYGVGWKLVARINEIKPPYSLHNVKTLYIPDARGTRRDIKVVGFWNLISQPFRNFLSKFRPGKRYYTVVADKGDKPQDIEAFAGIPWPRIAKYNNLPDDAKLKAGQEIRIPGRKPKA